MSKLEDAMRKVLEEWDTTENSRPFILWVCELMEELRAALAEQQNAEQPALPEPDIEGTVMHQELKICYMAPVHYSKKLMQNYAGACVAADRAARGGWKDAVDRELVTIGSTADSFQGPKEALSALIDWHVQVALDPAVSSEAEALVQRGRDEAALGAGEPVARGGEAACYIDKAELAQMVNGLEPKVSKEPVSEYDIPLYIHPPQCKTLTDERIDELFKLHHSMRDSPWVGWRRFARAVIAELNKE